jgi:ESCRT-I complex subunit VPS28
MCPVLSDLISSLSKISSLPPDFTPKEKAKTWYSRLYQRPANYELNDEEVRQMLFDLESSYNEFISTIR